MRWFCARAWHAVLGVTRLKHFFFSPFFRLPLQQVYSRKFCRRRIEKISIVVFTEARNGACSTIGSLRTHRRCAPKVMRKREPLARCPGDRASERAIAAVIE